MSISDIFWGIVFGLVVAYVLRLFVRMCWMQYLHDRVGDLHLIYMGQLRPGTEPYRRVQHLHELYRRAASHFFRPW